MHGCGTQSLTSDSRSSSIFAISISSSFFNKWECTDAPAGPTSSCETGVGLRMMPLVTCSRFLSLSFLVVATYPFPPYLSSCREHPGLGLREREQERCQADAPGEAAGTAPRGAGAQPARAGGSASLLCRRPGRVLKSTKTGLWCLSDKNVHLTLKVHERHGDLATRMFCVETGQL